VSYALRLLWRSPGYTLAAVLTLALGIGANTAIFSLADATLLRPLRVARPAELVAFKWSASLPDYREWAGRTDIFTGVTAASGTRATAVLDGAPEVIDAAFVSPNYFTLLGVRAARGRLLGAADEARRRDRRGDGSCVVARSVRRRSGGGGPHAPHQRRDDHRRRHQRAGVPRHEPDETRRRSTFRSRRSHGSAAARSAARARSRIAA
jgi:hypothetical protein